MSCYFTCVRALGTTPCQVERHGVGGGGENRDGNSEGRPEGAERDRECQKGRQMRARRAAGSGDKEASVCR